MSAILITGGTGFLGSYVLADLLSRPDGPRLALLTRARRREEAIDKLWAAMQLHFDAERFAKALERVDFVPGDLTAPGLALDAQARMKLTREVGSVLHIAASLNRKSAKACFNANLRGTLSVLQLAREIADGPNGLSRFSFVSTTAIAGIREHECVKEDEAREWARSDYDPYARTKKFAEHMVEELLPGTSTLILRPSTVMGDSRFAPTTQFDMVRAFCFFMDLPAVPIHARTRQDIVPADFVGRAIATLHTKPKPAHRIYHLSAGARSASAAEIAKAMLARTGRRAPRFLSPMQRPFAAAVDALASGPRGKLSLMASLLKVFLPYVTNDVVFDNERVVAELGERPAPFTDYCGPLYEWAKRARFTYPVEPLPERLRRALVEARPEEPARIEA